MMKNTDIRRIETWFDDYTSSFLTGDDEFDYAVRLKIEHSRRTAVIMSELAGITGLNGSSAHTAAACALLHDCGRFEQYRRYRTFNDRESVNHGELGETVLKESDVLADLPENEVSIILAAVRRHNEKELPDHLSPEQRLFADLVRDCDKIDIFRVVGDFYSDDSPDKPRSIVHFLPAADDISPEVYDTFTVERRTRPEQLKTEEDMKVFQLAWIWGFRNRAALGILAERGYIEKILSTLPETEKGKAVRKLCSDYMKTAAGEKKLRWKELSREKLFDCRIFRLLSSEREAADGRRSKAFLIDAPDWVTIVPVVRKDGKDYFVMVRQYRHGLMELTTEFPAGTLEADEDAHEAAERELLEETGYRAGKMTWLGSVNPNPAFLNNRFTAFLAEDLEATGTQNLDDNEYLDYELVPADEVISGMGSAEYSNGTMMMALLYYLRYRGS